ncbi:hypothetical protein NN561_002245 [Cricetulus griseus]
MIPREQRTRSGVPAAANLQRERGGVGDLEWGRGPGAPLPRAASSEKLLSSSSGSGTGRDGAGRSMGPAGSGGGQRQGGQRITLWPGLGSQREAPARRVQLSRPEEARRGRGPRGPSLRHCAAGVRRHPDSPAGTHAGHLPVPRRPPSAVAHTRSTSHPPQGFPFANPRTLQRFGSRCTKPPGLGKSAVGTSDRTVWPVLPVRPNRSQHQGYILGSPQRGRARGKV